MARLDGITIGITAQRRAAEFADALQRHGATVLHAPTIEIVSLPDDENLRAATNDILAEPVDVLAVTTGAGFRGWLETAEGWGIGERLRAALGSARIVVRGPKTKGAVRAAELSESWSAPGESNAELLEHLLAAGVSGLRVAVQVHGAPLPELTDRLTGAGASVVEVQPYRWQWPDDLSPAHRLLDAVLDGSVQALAFTSAPATRNLLTLAEQSGRYPELLNTLRAGAPVCACVCPVTAAPLTELDIPTIQPDRQRLGALVKLLTAHFGT